MSAKLVLVANVQATASLPQTITLDPGNKRYVVGRTEDKVARTIECPVACPLACLPGGYMARRSFATELHQSEACPNRLLGTTRMHANDPQAPAHTLMNSRCVRE